VDVVSRGDHGAGVAELIQELVDSDLSGRQSELRRARIPLGSAHDGQKISLVPLGEDLMIAGESGSGKSTLAMSIVEELTERAYQFCIVDPEGDYDGVEKAIILGDRDHEPDPEEVFALLGRPDQNLVVNLLSIPIEGRPAFFEKLLDVFRRLHRETGRPHRLILDEAHHLMPAGSRAGESVSEQHCQALILITVHPEHVAAEALSSMDRLVVFGKHKSETVKAFARAKRSESPAMPEERSPSDAWLWTPEEQRIVSFRPRVPRAEHRRHLRKYVEGALGDDKCFYFTGPHGDQRLKAQNLMMFLQLADGVDDATWLYHLRRGDYAGWFRSTIKNEDLASEVDQIPGEEVSPKDSRQRVRKAIEDRYTAEA
jgi:hypothetical protein